MQKVKSFQTELYSLQALICAYLNENTEDHRDFQPNGKVTEGDAMQDEYSVYEVPVIEYDHEKEEDYEHSFTVINNDDGTFKAYLTLTY